jgi:hypothetical protein
MEHARRVLVDPTATEFREARDSLPEEPRGVVPARLFSLSAKPCKSIRMIVQVFEMTVQV